MSSQGRLLCFVAVMSILPGCTMSGADEPGLGWDRSPIVGGVPESGYLGVGLLVFDEGGGYASMCTGTAIANNWVLTAAHCVEGKAPAAGIFFSGDDINDEYSGDAYGLRSLHAHPDYDPYDASNDIALIEVVGLTDLPTYTVNTTAPTKGLAVTYVGYGLNNAYAGTGDGVKRRGTGEVSEVYWTQLVHYTIAGVTPCQGDSGGPVFATISGSQRIVGVVSAGDEDCSEYTVSTRVDAFNDWIDDTMSGGTTPDCDIRGGDCGREACYPVSETEFSCFPSDGLGDGADCNASVRDRLVCADGLVCAPTSETDPTAGICVSFCLGNGDCDGDESCAMPAFEGIDDIGICVPGGGDECNILGGDCGGGEGCFPSQAGINACFPSDERARGAACNDDMATWGNTLPCDDGLICIAVEEGASGTCRDFCLGEGDCAGDEDCYAPIFEGIDDIGVCVPGEGGCTDSDGDGACAGHDCDDREPAAYPGAVERCNDGIDNDCDGTADEGCADCTDGDGDGYCSTVDCDDGDADVHPGQVEDCGNGDDDNCDGRIDSADEDCGGGGDGDGDTDGDDDDDDDEIRAEGCARCAAGPASPGGDALSFVIVLLGLAVLRRSL